MRFVLGATVILLLAPCGYLRAHTSIEQIETLAAGSQCGSLLGATKAYVSGMAVVFARSVCQSDRADVKVVSAARGVPGTTSERSDALTWYNSTFHQLGMSNSTDGPDTLRHAYVLMLGLGMRNSAGKYCVGRDQSAKFSSADSAEAGLFQTSWGAHKRHATLKALFDQYKADQNGCLFDLFSKNVTCSKWDARTWPTDDSQEEGANWQRLTKACPAFAIEYAAVVFRVHGGSRGEYGPIRRKQAKVMLQCDQMLSKVEKLSGSSSDICAQLP